MKKSKLADPNLAAALDLSVTDDGQKLAAKKKKFYHDELVQDDCPVCQHDAKGAITALYHRWMPVKEIQELTGIETKILKVHFLATGDTERRSHNTDSAISVLMERGMEAIKDEEINLVALIKHRDKLNKRVESSSDAGRPTIIIMNAPPTRTSLMTKGNVTLSGAKVVPVIGPGSTKEG